MAEGLLNRVTNRPRRFCLSHAYGHRAIVCLGAESHTPPLAICKGVFPNSQRESHVGDESCSMK
jgi:hypothetical protein